VHEAPQLIRRPKHRPRTDGRLTQRRLCQDVAPSLVSIYASGFNGGARTAIHGIPDGLAGRQNPPGSGVGLNT
jgi:hypothetical protein